ACGAEHVGFDAREGPRRRGSSANATQLLSEIFFGNARGRSQEVSDDLTSFASAASYQSWRGSTMIHGPRAQWQLLRELRQRREINDVIKTKTSQRGMVRPYGQGRIHPPKLDEEPGISRSPL